MVLDIPHIKEGFCVDIMDTSVGVLLVKMMKVVLNFVTDNYYKLFVNFGTSHTTEYSDQ